MERSTTIQQIAHTSKRTSLSVRALARQNRAYHNSGGVSAGNRGHGFCPAFLDEVTGIAYLSRFANGSAAPVHVLDGLPDELVIRRNAHGSVTAVRTGVIAGFFRDGVFYTRKQAALALSH